MNVFRSVPRVPALDEGHRAGSTTALPLGHMFRGSLPAPSGHGVRGTGAGSLCPLSRPAACPLRPQSRPLVPSLRRGRPRTPANALHWGRYPDRPRLPSGARSVVSASPRPSFVGAHARDKWRAGLLCSLLKNNCNKGGV